ncbi:MAG: hypothetical protein IJE43_19850 [Alphaproteobacteria bacterium]|nr:hypothetical protein [Alphaproteobacteria bacterium]
MFLKRLFCRKHEWVKIDYKEIKDDTDRVLFRDTIYQCKKCGKKYTHEHLMPRDFGIW